MQDPLISIIVPVYNVDKYLTKCLDSLLEQTLTNIEIVCINDASTDNSLSILYKYAKQDGRLKVINLKENKRQGGARNEGLKVASGEFVGFVDSDDWVDVEMFKCLYNKAKEEKADICVCDYYKTHSTYIEECKTFEDSIFNLNEYQKKKRIIIEGGHLCCALIKRSLIMNNHLFFPEGVIYEDNAVGGAMFLCANKIVKVCRPLYYYRQNNVSTTRSINNWNYFDRLKTSISFLENMKRIDTLQIYKEEIEFRFYVLYYINTIWGCVNLFSPPAIQKINSIKDSIKKYVDIKGNKYYKTLSANLRFFLAIIQTNTRLGVLCLLFIKRLKAVVNGFRKKSM